MDETGVDVCSSDTAPYTLLAKMATEICTSVLFVALVLGHNASPREIEVLRPFPSGGAL